MARSRKAVGVFTTDRSLVVQTWDAWMADATGIPESAAVGEPIIRLYPELGERGLMARLRRVADGTGVELLAPALHKYLIPCLPQDRSSRFERMRQHVTVAPLHNKGVVEGVIVTIEDVTHRFDRERRLAAELDSEDESIRLRAAKALAADRDSPSLLSTALGDPSWRVRRVAAEGMAAAGGRAVIDTLVEAVRDNHRNPALLNAAVTALAQAPPDVVVAVIPLLESDDADVRTYAALALGLMDDPRGVPPLLALLDDPDTNVRYHAIEALGRLGDRRAADALVAIAELRDFYLAFPALDALAAIGDPTVAPRLIALLDDEMLMPAVVACLGAIGGEEVATPLAELLNRADAPAATIAHALACVAAKSARFGGQSTMVVDLVRSAVTDAAAEHLIAGLRRADGEELRGVITVLSWLPSPQIDQHLASLLLNDAVRDMVAERLSDRGVPAASVLEPFLADDTPDVRRAAASAIGRIGAPVSVPAVMAALEQERDAHVIAVLVSALGVLGDRRPFEQLLALMDHPETVVRQAVVGALNSISHPRTEAAISGKLSDPSPRVRESASRVAGYFGYASCLRQMVELCDDSDPTVRRATVESLANFDKRPAWSKIYETVLSDEDASVRAAAVRALSQQMSDDSLPAIVAALHDPSLWVRYYAARACMRRDSRHADVIAALLECAVRDQTTPVRISAIDALGALAAPSTLDILTTVAADADADVARAAVGALGHFSADDTGPTLLLALENPDIGMQHAALDAIGMQGAAAGAAVAVIGPLARLTRNDAVRRHSVQALVEIGSDSATRTLVFLAGHHRFGELAAFAIAKLGVERLPVIERELERCSEVVRAIVVDAVGHMQSGQARAMLAKALDDRSTKVRTAAAQALARLDLLDAAAGRD